MAYSPLYFLHKNTHKQLLLWIKLFSFCFAMHLFVLLLFFVGYRDRITALTLIVNASATSRVAPIQFVTFHEPKPTVAQAQKSSATYIQPKKSEAKTFVKKEKPVTQKMETPKSLKSSTQKKVEQPKQQNVRPSTEKKEVSTKKELPVAEQRPIAIPVGKNVQHLEDELAVFQDQLLHVWSPPAGLNPGCACTITLHVQPQGLIDTIEIIESSNMPLFDIIARNSVSEVEIPKWAWGRSISVTFM